MQIPPDPVLQVAFSGFMIYKHGKVFCWFSERARCDRYRSVGCFLMRVEMTGNVEWY